MRSTLRPPFTICSIFALLVPAAAATGRTCVDPHRVAVALERSSACVPVAELPGFAGEPPAAVTLEGIGEPLHGSAEVVAGDEICYTPGDDFWSLGSDSFTYRYAHVSVPVSVHTGIVQLVASLSAETTFADDFDDRILDGWDVNDPMGRLTFREWPQGSQAYRLQVAGSGEAPAFLTRHTTPGNTDEHGTTDDCFCFHFTGGVPGAGLLMEEATILKAHFDGEPGEARPPPLEIRYQREDATTKLRAGAWDAGLGVDCATPWLELDAPGATLQLDLWRHHGEGAGVMLRLDGRNAGLARCDDWRIGTLERMELGVVEGVGSAGPFDFDDLVIAERSSEQPGPEPTIDTFECGLVGWTPGGDRVPEVDADAALSGVLGLVVGVGAIARSGAGHGFLLGTEAAAPASFDLRFLLDLHDVELADGDAFVLAGGFGGEATPGQEHLQLKVGEAGGVLEIWAEARDGSTFSATARTPLGPGAHVVELQWRAAAWPGSADGWLRLWIDGAVAGESSGIDTGGRRVDAFRIGAAAVPAGALGSIFIDDVETWDATAPPLQ